MNTRPIKNSKEFSPIHDNRSKFNYLYYCMFLSPKLINIYSEDLNVWFLHSRLSCHSLWCRATWNILEYIRLIPVPACSRHVDDARHFCSSLGSGISVQFYGPLKKSEEILWNHATFSDIWWNDKGDYRRTIDKKILHSYIYSRYTVFARC